jgi:hypothetical protein
VVLQPPPLLLGEAKARARLHALLDGIAQRVGGEGEGARAAAGAGGASPGRYSHSETTLCIPSAIINRKHTGRCQSGCNVCV